MSIRILLYETKASDWEEQKDQVLDKTLAIYYGCAEFQWLLKLLITLLTSPLETGRATLVFSMLRPSDTSMRFQFRKGVQGPLLLMADERLVKK